MLRSIDSQLDLLEQDSEMQRAMGDVLNSENEGMIAPMSTLLLGSSHIAASTSAHNVAQSTPIPSVSRPSSSLRGSKNGPKLEPRPTSYELDCKSLSSSVDRFGLTDSFSDKLFCERAGW